jgi:DNA-binding NarL/FixJ family response regulator
MSVPGHAHEADSPLLIEDHFLAQMALRSVLSCHSQIRIVGEAAIGEQGIELFRSLLPDVVVLDLRLPRMSGFEVITLLRKERHPCAHCSFIDYHRSEDIYRAVKNSLMQSRTSTAI